MLNAAAPPLRAASTKQLDCNLSGKLKADGFAWRLGQTKCHFRKTEVRLLGEHHFEMEHELIDGAEDSPIVCGTERNGTHLLKLRVDGP